MVSPEGEELARFSVDSSLAYPVIGAAGTVYVSDSANVVRAISTSACTETQADLHRPTDITGDRITNFEDYTALLGDYLACTDVANTEAACNGSGPSVYLADDVDRNLYVAFEDVLAMAAMWLGID